MITDDDADKDDVQNSKCEKALMEGGFHIRPLQNKYGSNIANKSKRSHTGNQNLFKYKLCPIVFFRIFTRTITVFSTERRVIFLQRIPDFAK